MKLLTSGHLLLFAVAAVNVSFYFPQTAGQLASDSNASIGRAASSAGGFLTIAWTKRGFDNANTNWNKVEPFFTAANVNPTTFGKLWTKTVTGVIYAQPLYVSGLKIQNAMRDVVFVATESNDVYAFDVNTTNQLWHKNLGSSVPSGTVGCGDLTPEYGISSTPVIVTGANRMYLVAKTLENSAQVWRIHALDLITGNEAPGWGFKIQGSIPGTPPVVFQTNIQLNRCGLAYANSRVYVAFGSHCDISLNQYHGWVFSYDTRAPGAPPQIWNSTPSADGSREQAAGIWSGGAAPAFDENGDMYLMTGNGPMDIDLDGVSVGDAFVKVRTNHGATLAFSRAPADYFSPANQVFLDSVDADLGSGGLVLIPDQPNLTTPKMLCGGGKDALLRLINRNDMGAFTGRANQNAPNNVIQEVSFPNGFWSSPSYADAGAGPCIYVNAVGDRLKQYSIGADVNGKGHLTFVAQGPTSTGYPSATPVITSMGTRAGTGVVWMVNRTAKTLEAYNAMNVANQIYSSATNSARDGIDTVIKFTVPTVVNGRVFVGGDNKFFCYGLL